MHIFYGTLFVIKANYTKKDQNQMKIILAFILMATEFLAQSAKDSTKSFNRNPNYELQLGMQSISKIRQADIVMFGNSITHGGNWNELLGRKNVVERGIPSDNTEGMLNRINTIIKLNPKICFILAGVNDIYSGFTADYVYSNYIKIIETLKSKKIMPVIQSCIYSGKNWGSDWNLTPEFNRTKNQEIEKLNTLLKDYAMKNNIDFIDLNLRLSDSGFLKPEMTYDNLHLNYKGYKLWVNEVEKILIKYGL
jgi:lysophospholipase L1-like esterase